MNHSRNIPAYITAGSLIGLRRLMFITNAKYGAQLKYFDISQFTDERGKRSWVAWFYVDLLDIGDLNDDAK